MDKKTALIIGANGQDASYLAEFLLEKDYQLYGTIRRNSVPESQTTRIETLRHDNNIKLVYADLTDYNSIHNAINISKPDEIYHLGAQSHVQVSFELPKYTLDVNAGGTLAVLESVRTINPSIKVYHAATSEMFGNNKNIHGFQNENTPMNPVSPYGCSKLYAHTLCNNYRNSYNMFVCSGILFNHESERRGINFVTNKIVLGAVKIKMQLESELLLGNLNSMRDWGHAKDYVRGMWMMLQQATPVDYILATGKTYTVLEFLSKVFEKLELNWEKYVKIDPRFIRPEELDYLRGDATKAEKELGWHPTITLDEMIDEMIKYWVQNLTK
jgi:GDPmannose 4,6-dehydratase